MLLRIGIVGTARILPSHLRGMRALLQAGLADFRITALVGRTTAGAMAFRRRGEGPAPRPPVGAPGDPLAAEHLYVSDVHPDTLPECFGDVRAMLDAGCVDAVLLLTPVHLHHTQAIACLEAGVHVLCEKPLAVSVRAGRAMVEAALRHGRVLGVAEGVAYDATVRLQAWAVRGGVVGPVEMVLMGGVGTGAWSPDRIVAETPWRHRKLEAGGGPSIDIGVHQFDHIRAVAGEVAEVTAMTARFAPERVTPGPDGSVSQRVHPDVEDTFHAVFRLATGGLGHVSFSWAGHGDPTFWPGGPVVYGGRGVLKGRRWQPEGGAEVDLASLAGAEAQQDAWFPGGIRDTKALQFLDFLRAVSGGPTMEADGDQGLADLACAMAVLESAAARQVVRVADVLSGAVDAYQRPIDTAHGLGGLT